MRVQTANQANDESQASQLLVVQAFSLVASCLEFPSYQAAATGLATNLATRLQCERVSIGLSKNQRLHISAMSYSARWDKRSNLVQSINAAMDESCDQETTIVYPVPVKDAKKKFVGAHKKLSDSQKSVVLCTVPLSNEGQVTGAITLERNVKNRFQPSSVQLIELVATIAGPLLEMKRLEERWIVRKLWESILNAIGRIIGLGFIKTKLILLIVSSMVVFMLMTNGTHRVTADSILEGSVQRTISAASDGYVMSSAVRAGDTVSENQVMAKLDDKDLQLEIEKLKSQRSQLEHEFQDALVQHKRLEISVLTVKLSQIDTELDLINERLARLKIVSPFDGIVLEGDLTQALGMPIKRGDVMFKIAPLNDYRVILSVDETDISYMQVNQHGMLTLTGLPDENFDIAIEKITPVSKAKDGRSVFHVEAKLSQNDPQLRPNMKGISKIEIGEKKLFWIFTHKLVDWFYLHTWAFLP